MSLLSEGLLTPQEKLKMSQNQVTTTVESKQDDKLQPRTSNLEIVVGSGDDFNVEEDKQKPEQELPKDPISLSDLPIEDGFQPDIEEEFPHIENAEPKIPHIIHLIWMTGNASASPDPVIPETFVENIKTFLKNHPNWTYYFWTDISSRQLIADRHKSLLSAYDHAPKLVVKTDILRYVLMYEFGGVYTDLDTVSVRPLDIATTKYPCVLVPIPFEQAVIWTFMPFRLCNGEMMCRAKHPFFKQCIEALPERINITFFPKIAGPLFIDEMYKKYNNISKTDAYRVDMHQETNTPYFFKGINPPSGEDSVYIPNTRYFLNNPSLSLKRAQSSVCAKPKQTNLVQRACHSLSKHGYNRTSKYNFIKHGFAGSWMGGNANRLRLVSLNSVFTNYKIYNGQN